MCEREGMSYDLARVEGINSAHVYAARVEKKECQEEIWNLIAEHPNDLEAVYQYIRDDHRFIFNWIPIDGEPIRYPNRLYTVDGGDLRYLLAPGVCLDKEIEEAMPFKRSEYDAFCEEADARE